jgi:hypothetical protein
MRWILDLDILLLVSGIDRKHEIMPKTIFGVPSILPPPKKIHFLPRRRDFSRKRVCGFSIWRLQEIVFNRANLFGGAICMFPPCNPPNPVSSRGLRKLSNQFLVLGQSRTKTLTKTHLAKSSNTNPQDCLLVQNLHMMNTKKHEKSFCRL